jgi:hypothetical protein
MEPEHTRVDRENRELEDVIATRDEAVAARARYYVDMAAAEATAKRFHLDSYLAEALERRKRQDEESDRWLARRKECVRPTRSDDGVVPSGGQ